MKSQKKKKHPPITAQTILLRLTTSTYFFYPPYIQVQACEYPFLCSMGTNHTPFYMYVYISSFYVRTIICLSGQRTKEMLVSHVGPQWKALPKGDFRTTVLAPLPEMVSTGLAGCKHPPFSLSSTKLEG